MKFKQIEVPVCLGDSMFTIFIRGRLGLNRASVIEYGLSKGKSMSFGYDEEDKDEILYAALHTEANSEYSIKKVNDNHYVTTERLMKHLKFDYEGKKITFDLEKIPSKDKGIECYIKMTPRYLKRGKL